MTVVVVGPTTIIGPADIDADLVASALECIDEPLGVLDATVVPAERIWRDAMTAATGTASAVTVVCPTWWSPSRIERVRAALRRAPPPRIPRFRVVFRSQMPPILCFCEGGLRTRPSTGAGFRRLVRQENRPDAGDPTPDGATR